MIRFKSALLWLFYIMFCLGTYAQEAKDEGLYPIIHRGKYGFINKYGQEVVKPEYQAVNFYKEGMAAVRKGGYYGYLDLSGKECIPFEYDYALNFKFAYAIVYKNGKPMVINKKGQKQFECNYNRIYPADIPGYFVSQGKNERLGLIDSNGNVLLDTIYSYIDFHKGNVVVAKDYFQGFTVLKGNKIVFNSKESEYYNFQLLSDAVLISEEKRGVKSQRMFDFEGKILFELSAKASMQDYPIKKLNETIFLLDTSLVNTYVKGFENLNLKNRYVLFHNHKPINSFNHKFYKIVVNAPHQVYIEGKKNWHKVHPITGGKSLRKYRDVRNLTGSVALLKRKKWVVKDSKGKVLRSIPAKGLSFDYGVLQGRTNFAILGETDGFIDFEEDEEGGEDDEEVFKLWDVKRKKSIKIIDQPADGQFHRQYFNELIIAEWDNHYGKYPHLDSLMKKIYRNVFLAYCNTKGKCIWREQLYDYGADTISRLDIDYFAGAIFTSEPSTIGLDYPYEQKFEKIKPSDEALSFAKSTDSIAIHVIPKLSSVIISPDLFGQEFFRGAHNFFNFEAYEGVLVNNSRLPIKDDLYNTIEMTLQAKDLNGNWKNIDKKKPLDQRPIELGVNGGYRKQYYRTIEPNQLVSFKIPLFKGVQKTMFRIEFKTYPNKLLIYSNEFEGEINPAQFLR